MFRKLKTFEAFNPTVNFLVEAAAAEFPLDIPPRHFSDAPFQFIGSDHGLQDYRCRWACDRRR